MLDMSHDFRADILARLIATPSALAEPVVAPMPLPAEPYAPLRRKERSPKNFWTFSMAAGSTSPNARNRSGAQTKGSLLFTHFVSRVSRAPGNVTWRMKFLTQVQSGEKRSPR
jgi:hypothetical protein